MVRANELLNHACVPPIAYCGAADGQIVNEEEEEKKTESRKTTLKTIKIKRTGGWALAEGLEVCEIYGFRSVKAPHSHRRARKASTLID